MHQVNHTFHCKITQLRNTENTHTQQVMNSIAVVIIEDFCSPVTWPIIRDASS